MLRDGGLHFLFNSTMLDFDHVLNYKSCFFFFDWLFINNLVNYTSSIVSTVLRND